ncbi:hypothetical protein [Actinoplanes regularis]|nr:hypothetical protein [Actinoplanes regularis]GIE86816.1 hypothetical protein Are01nite_32960 [Actinoplanes regularis]
MATPARGPIRIAVSGIDGSGKTELCQRIAEYVRVAGRNAHIVGNLPRAYRQPVTAVVDLADPRLSSFFFNYAKLHHDDAGRARSAFTPRFVDYVMALEEVRIHHEAMAIAAESDVVVHDRHELDRRVHALRAGCNPDDLNLVFDQIPAPDLSVLLDLPARTALERITRRGTRGYDENEADLTTNRCVYLDLVRDRPQVTVVDARPAAAVVFNTVAPLVTTLLTLRHLEQVR